MASFIMRSASVVLSSSILVTMRRARVSSSVGDVGTDSSSLVEVVDHAMLMREEGGWRENGSKRSPSIIIKPPLFLTRPLEVCLVWVLGVLPTLWGDPIGFDLPMLRGGLVIARLLILGGGASLGGLSLEGGMSLEGGVSFTTARPSPINLLAKLLEKLAKLIEGLLSSSASWGEAGGGAGGGSTVALVIPDTKASSTTISVYSIGSMG